jgi:ligand-binding sensor domain-containing protein
MTRAKAGIALAALLFFARLADTRTFSIREFNIDNGLPHNRINRIYRDSRNFLWIGTDDGLVRFDGRQFTTYSTSDGLPHMHVNAVLETRAGEYWIATDGGIAQFDPRPATKRFITYVPSRSPATQAVNTIYEDADGSLLLGTNGGLFRFTRSRQFTAINYHPSHGNPGSVKVNAIASDGGWLWLATEYGLYGYDPSGAWAQYGQPEGFPWPFVFTMTHDRQGRLWVGFRGGFGRLAEKPQSKQPILDLVRTSASGAGFIDARAILISADSTFRIATEAGLVEWLDYATSGNQFRRHTAAEGFKEEETHDLALDSAGNLWIGTRRSGITCVAKTEFRTFTGSDGLVLSENPMLLESPDGDVCTFDITTSKRRLHCYDRVHDRIRASNFSVPARFDGVDPHWLETVQPDGHRGWWISTIRGMFHSSSVEAAPTRKFGSHVTRFYQDLSGDLWMSFMFKDKEDRRGILHWSQRAQALSDETSLLPPEAVSRGVGSFAQASNGDLWLGLERPGGLVRRRGTHYEFISDGPTGHISQLFVDSRSRLWIASTESGLGRIDDLSSEHPGIRLYTRSDGMLSEEVWSVTEDRYGRVYAGSARGVDRLQPETGKIVHFTVADGLPNGDIRSSFCTHAGELWFASSHGISQYKPEFGETRTAVPTRITSVRIAGVPFPLPEFGLADVDPLTLAADKNSLQVDYGAADFSFTAPIAYQFRSAANRPWQDVGRSTSLNLLNLAPGAYSIGIRAVSRDAGDGPPAFLNLIIQPPFWATWWFRVLGAFVIFSGFYAVHVGRLKKRVAIERIRTELATDLHDDVGASLSRIHIMGEAIRSRMSTANGTRDRMMDEIVDSSRRLLSEMNDIVWSLNPQRDSFADLVSRIRAFGTGLLEQRGVVWTVESVDPSLPLYLSPEIRRQLYVIFKEGINNIAKHARARRATLRFWRENGIMYGELTDDGCGTPRNGICPTGNGIGNMQARARKIGGALAIETGPGFGTRVTLRLPLRKHVHALVSRRR